MHNILRIFKTYHFISFQTKALGNTALTSTATSNFLVTNIDTTLQGQLVTEFNNIITAINNIATPDCTS